ncbi:MAG: type II secretion system major pseudopilin GspG [Magnetococcales bacterium]|nr:type II secretion system major pseudopilin GspG [Magnetococcales bacterium]
MNRPSPAPARPDRAPAARQAGFTLIEVMVVVVILAILATIVAPKVMGRPDEARIAKAKQDLAAIENALNLYKLDNFRYPTTDEGLDALVHKPENAPNWKDGGYLSRAPKDPWGRPYLFLNPGTHGKIDIFTLGADGVEGGKEADADLGNWNLE